MLRSLLILALVSVSEAPPPQELAPGVTVIPGVFPPDRGPDGNTIVLDAPEGLIVVDTGRHVEHSDAILAYAASRGRNIAAIVNTHWHLDHSSGNGRIKAQFPHALLYTTNAVDRALAPSGFLARNLGEAQQMLSGPDAALGERAEIQIFVDTMAHSESLRPDVPVSGSERVRIAGRRLDVHVADGAVTDADIWLYDRRTRVAIIGDLVTFPVPFFETACPQHWRATLDEVWAVPFRVAITGHGEAMTRAEFNIWRRAYAAFIECVGSDRGPATCAADWTEAIAQLIQDDPFAQRAAPQMAAYYVTFLRENGGKSPDCLRD